MNRRAKRTTRTKTTTRQKKNKNNFLRRYSCDYFRYNHVFLQFLIISLIIILVLRQLSLPLVVTNNNNENAPMPYLYHHHHLNSSPTATTTATTRCSTHPTLTKKEEEEEEEVIRIRRRTAKIAYVIVLTDCISGKASAPQFILDAAAVLSESIRRLHPPPSTTNNPNNYYSQYPLPTLIVIVHEDAANANANAKANNGNGNCAEVLPILHRVFNYTIVTVPSPIRPHDIGRTNHTTPVTTTIATTSSSNNYVRDHIQKDGCCGEKELIKLHIYTMIDYDIVICMDLDTILLQPLDILYDTMLLSASKKKKEKDNNDECSTTKINTTRMVVTPRFNRPLPSHDRGGVHAFFTRDYRLVPLGHSVPIQGGFLMVRPSLDAYNEMLSMIQSGNYIPNKPGRPQSSGSNGVVGGWDNTGHGLGYGGLTVQGIVPWFYDETRLLKETQEQPQNRHIHNGVELDECYYNTQFSQSRHDGTTKGTKNDIGKCTTGLPEQQCEDCTRHQRLVLVPSSQNTDENHDTSIEQNAEDNADETNARNINDNTSSIVVVKTAHFAGCGKPWRCWNVTDPSKYAPNRRGPKFTHQKLCTELHRIWFLLRRDVEETLIRNGKVVVAGNNNHNTNTNDGKFLSEVFGGYCHSSGYEGYIPLNFV